MPCGLASWIDAQRADATDGIGNLDKIEPQDFLPFNGHHSVKIIPMDEAGYQHFGGGDVGNVAGKTVAVGDAFEGGEKDARQIGHIVQCGIYQLNGHTILWSVADSYRAIMKFVKELWCR